MDHSARTAFLEGVKQLFDNLQNLVEFEFVAAGKTKFNPNNPATRKFDCSPEACSAMKIQACIVDMFWLTGEDYISPMKQDAFDFFQCMFKNKAMKPVTENAEVCAELVDGWFGIETCINNEGDNLLGENVKRTHDLIELANGNPDTIQFPAFILDEKDLITDVEMLRMRLCAGIDNAHQPDICYTGFAKKIPLNVFFQSDSELSKYFFTTQYDPWYMNIEEMVNVQLVAGGDTIDSPAGDCDKKFDADSPCFGNLIQAYVIGSYQNNPNENDWVDGTMRTMHFLRCAYSHPLWKKDYITSSEDCAEEHLGADAGFDLIQAVKADAVSGDSFYKKSLATTAQFLEALNQKTFGLIPWVAIGEKKDHSKRAADDLLQTICGLWEGDKPRECTPVNVEVYYSGFHPQSRRFFVDELIPVFRNIRERIHLDLIPYGIPKNADPDCKSSACQANRLQACAVKKYFADEHQEDTIQWDGKNQTLLYIHCMFKNVKNNDIGTLSEECANKNIILAEDIRKCATSQEGVDALNEMKQKTLNLNMVEEMDVAPWVVINGKRVAAAQTDLRKAICAELSNVQYGDLPDYCIGERAAKVALQVHYSTLDDDSEKYIVQELYQNYRDLEEIMALDLVPLGACTTLNIPNHPVVQCPGHDDESHAALIHACVIETFWKNDDGPVTDNDREFEYDGKIQVVEFLKCYFNSPNYPEKPTEAAATCVEQVFGDIWAQIDECARGNEGFDILENYQKTKVEYLAPSMKYTPWITVNGVHNYAVENHIKRTTCDAYMGAEKPLNCYDPVEPAEKPVVQVHYEVDDSKSVNFFTKFFSADTISQLAVTEFIPFGRSVKSDDGKFTCQNDAECHKYRQHVCLIESFYKTEPIPTLKTIACTFEAGKINSVNGLNDCFDREFEDANFDAIITCQKDTEASDKLLTNAANAVTGLNKKISHSPWIVINGEHNLEAELNKGLADEICAEYYPNDKPKGCQVEMVPVGVYYQTRDQDVQKWFSEQLSQQTEYLAEIGNFDFVPYGKTTQNGDGSFACSNEDQCHANMIHVSLLTVCLPLHFI